MQDHSFSAACARLGLDPEQIKRHQARLRTVLVDGKPSTFSVIDTCRFDNAGVLSCDKLLAALPRSESTEPGFIAFIPSAGASSRYLQPLATIQNALLADNLPMLQQAYDALPVCDWLNLGLPLAIKSLLRKLSERQPVDELTRKHALAAFQLPKALMPAVADGDSFIQTKVREHQAIGPSLGAEIYVVAPSTRSVVEQDISEFLTANPDYGSLAEQDASMSTIRFEKTAEPVWHDDSLSLVPAGHGTLTSLFPAIAKRHQTLHSLWIRNIDNVTGTSDEVVDASHKFLACHADLLNLLQQIRRFCRTENFQQAAESATPLSSCLVRNLPSQAIQRDVEKELANISDSALKSLWEIVFYFFHTFPKAVEKLGLRVGDQRSLQILFDRPLATLGQVSNTGKDVGGTPVFIDSDYGPVKICLELPHANSEDQDTYFRDPRKATHFNPVFAAFELRHNHDAKSLDILDDDPFWIVAEKPFLGRKVFYHETVLYELIGNSVANNCIFVDIPRLLFNPHKTIFDTLNTASAT